MQSEPKTVMILFSILFVSCGSVYSEDNSPILVDELKYHAIHSENLRDIMHRMNQLVYEKELNDMQKSEIRTGYIQNLVDTVNELAVASESLTEALPGFDLSEEEKNIFQGLAKQLQIEAYNIRLMAERFDDTEMQAAYQRFNDTCSVCHELFRF